MAIAVALFAILIIVLSLWGVILPGKLISFVTGFMRNPASVWFAAGIRLVLAALLWFSAPLSATPLVFQVLAIIAVIAAIGLVLAGHDRLLGLVERVARWPEHLLRLYILLGVLFGAFLLWSIYPALS
ncbi:MAG: hypothetical protein KJO55_09090 [Gammaproteobacteria bacterium]|nr:hypothetical protein [Gammaproteobacteria bacterium]NND60489.1 hypothetical protein [Gammaproteobacteria bacterium]